MVYTIDKYCFVIRAAYAVAIILFSIIIFDHYLFAVAFHSHILLLLR